MFESAVVWRRQSAHPDPSDRMSLVVSVARSDLCNTIARVNDALAPAESKAKPPGNSFKTRRLPTIQLNLLTSESRVSKLGAFFPYLFAGPAVLGRGLFGR